MQTVIALLVGMLLGGLLVRWFMILSERRVIRPHHFDEHYAAAKRAVHRHLRAHGTLNHAELVRMLEIPDMTALRYLDQMVRDGHLKLQENHRTEGSFYTRP
jgi:hypothetical protein